jgi:ferredoxin/flavodoxin
MEIKRVYAVYFSPTGNTEKVVAALAEAVGKKLGAVTERFDFTLPPARTETRRFGPSDLVIFGIPVYAGRIPNKILPFVQSGFSGNGALAVPVVTYGNRSFDNGLIELRNELEQGGFHTVAGAAVVARHPFSETLGAGRPDAEDLAILADFAVKVAEIAAASDASSPPVQVPGDDPVGPYYTPLGLDGAPVSFLKAKPKTDPEKCNNCGICARVCPMGSINPDNVFEVTGVCIKCHACVRKCPQGAKYFDDPALVSHLAMLEQGYQRRAESVVFY